MLKFEIPIWTTMLWVRASVISYKSQWDDCYSDNCDEMSKYEVFCPMETEYVSYISLSNFHLDHSGFRLQLQWYWKDFFEMTNIEIISKKCSFSKSQSELQWYELELPCYLINLLWDDSYSDICDDMSEFEVFSSTRSKYGSSIALSNFHLDYTWFRLELQWY